MKLRTLMFIITIFAVLAVGAVFFYGRSAQIDPLVRQSLSDQTESQVLQADSLAQIYLSNAMANTQKLSSDPSITSAVLNAGNGSVEDAISELDSEMRFQPAFQGVSVFNSDCILVATPTYIKSILGKNFSSRDYCSGSRESELYVSGGFISSALGVPSFSVTSQIKDRGGKYAGFVSATPNGRLMYDYLRGIHANSSAAYTLLFDKYGKTLVDTRVPFEKTDLDSNSQAFSAISASGSKSGVLDLNGDTVGFRRSQYFTVAVVQPQSEFLRLKSERVKTLLEVVLWVSVLILAIGLLQTFLVTRSVGGLFRDLDETKKAEKELMEHKEFFQNIIAHSPTATYVVDTQGRLVVVNKLAEKMGGYLLSEVAGKHFTKFVKEASLLRIISAFSRVLGGKTVRGLEVELANKDGSTYKLILDATPLMKNGKVEFVIATGTPLPRARKRHS